MPFIVESNGRIHDPERDIRLVPSGGGSDGRLRFVLRGVGFEVPFCAYRDAKYIEGADPELPPLQRTLVSWKIDGFSEPPGWSRDQFEHVIKEAMTVFRFGHGMPEGQHVRVVFARNGVWDV